MRRLSICTTAVLLFLTTLAVVNSEKISRSEPGAKETVPVARPRVTIVFRGLLAFHPDPARQYFEAGILRVPEHRFRIEVRVNSSAGVSSFAVPSESLSGADNDVWSFEFTSSAKRGVNFYKNGAFDRKAGIGDERDFRWAVDVEGKEFYNQQLTTKQNKLGPIMRVTSGEFYTRTRTLPLLRNRGNGTFEYFGRAADEIAAGLFVDSGDVVLRSTKSGKEILRLKDKPGTTYEIVVENEYMTEAHAANTSHFSYYYRLIAKPRDEWYDFKVADDTFSAHRQFNHASYASPGSNRTPCMLWGLGKRKEALR
jgi:hypothetical protein